MGGLQKTTVIDLTAYVAGPACARIMGELGAEVIKVEPFGGDEMRTQGMAWGMKFRTEFDDVAMDCTSFNKRWVSINLKTEDGHAFMMRLLEKADILLTSYRDKALEHLGLDYETLKENFRGWCMLTLQATDRKALMPTTPDLTARLFGLDREVIMNGR